MHPNDAGHPSPASRSSVAEFRRQVQRHKRRTVQTREPRRSVPFRDFRQLARQVRPSALLQALGEFASSDPDFGFGGVIDGAYAPPWAVALIAREAILHGNEFRQPTVTPGYLRQLFNAHNDIADPSIRDESFDPLSVLTRLAYEQFPYQESIFEELSRTHALMVEGVHSLSLEVLGDPDVWHRLLGAALEEVVGATFFLQVAASQNHGRWDDSWLDRDDLEEIFNLWPRHVIRHRARTLTATVEGFRSAYSAAPSPQAGHERFAYNPLVATPFIDLENGITVAPQPRLILRTITPGALYYPGMNQFGSAFARDLGRLTERYVGALFGAVDSAMELHGEISYGRPERKSVDWFVVLPSAVVLIEVKSARFGLLERAAAPGYQTRVAGLLNKAVGQLVATSERLDSNDPAFAAIPRDRPRIGIVVTGEPFYLANSGWMRELIKEAPFPTLTASLRVVEHLCGLSLDALETDLTRIVVDPERSTWNLGVAISKEHQGISPVLENAWEAYPWPI